MKYDKDNVFAKIIRKEIPANIVYEDDFVLAFKDINPKAPIHILVIPKGEFISFFDFSQNASPQESHAFNNAIHKIIQDLGIEKTGFRILSNHGQNGGQEVPHFHVHIFGGKDLGAMLAV